LLDEPSVGVDPVSRQDLWDMVAALTGQGLAVIWATAYLDEAERCESVLLLNEGELRFAGPPAALTGRISHRCFRIRAPRGDRRALLQQALNLPSVCDGVIQGEAIRLVLRQDQSPDAIQALARAAGAQLEAVTPRFEDAFVDLLGGGPGGTSALAERMPPQDLALDYVVECRHLTKRFGAFVATDEVTFQVRPWRDLRPARAQWGGQVHHLQDALRPAQAQLRRGPGGGTGPAARQRSGQGAPGLHGPEILALWAALRAAEPGVLCRRPGSGGVP
jgi:ABC-type glutathione transport system ATPase component